MTQFFDVRLQPVFELVARQSTGLSDLIFRIYPPSPPKKAAFRLPIFCAANLLRRAGFVCVSASGRNKGCNQSLNWLPDSPPDCRILPFESRLLTLRCSHSEWNGCIFGTPGAIRTRDLPLRREEFIPKTIERTGVFGTTIPVITQFITQISFCQVVCPAQADSRFAFD